MSKWIIELPDNLDNPYFCSLCHPHDCNGARGCPIPNAKRAVEVRFDIDKDTGLSVVDSNGRFHFEGHDRYYAVEVE